MTNEVTPEQPKSKREELVDALTMNYVGMALYHKNRAIAERIVDRVIQAGWQWHPPKLEDFDLDHNKIALKEYPDRTPEQEIEIIDRIIAGQPITVTRATYRVDDEVVAIQQFPGVPGAIIAPNIHGVTLFDVNSQYPQEVKELWTRIPEFDNYEIDYISKTVRSRWTKRTLETTDEGGTLYTEMHDKDGFPHYVSVDYAYEMTFGK